MQHTVLISIASIFAVVIIWQLAVWAVENAGKSRKYHLAIKKARESGKPLLVVGGPWGTKPYRHWIKLPAHGGGDLCLDIDRRALVNVPGAIEASVTDIPIGDKKLGAVFVSHVLEHLPTAEAGKKAFDELDRVADAVFLVYPFRQSLAGWFTKGHHIWVWQKGNRTYFKQRGPAGNGGKIVVESAIGND